MLADRAAALLFYVATGAAVVTGVVWLALGDPDEAVVRVVTVLVISCPHALGLAIPLTTSLSSAIAARNGILVKDRLALEQSRTIDAFLFDKTGTLTKGQHTVTGVAGVGLDEDEVLRLAAGGGVRQRAPPRPGDRHGRPSPGRRRVGDRVPVDHRPRGRSRHRRRSAYAVGGPALLRERRLGEPDRAGRAGRRVEGARAPRSCTSCASDQIVGALALEDEVRPEARDAVAQLQAIGPAGRDDHR